MLGGRPRARREARARRRGRLSSRRNAEALPFRRPQLRRLHDRLRHPQRAAHRARRSPKRIACCKPGGRFLCLEFSTVDVPGLDALYELYSFNVIPALGRAVAGDAEPYRYLVESIRRFPQPEAFAAMMRGGRLRAACRYRPMSGGIVALHSGWRSVIAGASRHLVAPRAAPASCSRARACSALVDPAPLPPPARLALRLARLIERPTARRRSGAAVGGADPARADLREARPVPGDAPRRGRRRARARSRSAAGQDGAVPAGRGGGRGRGRARPAARRRFRDASARRSPPPRSRRCTAPRSRRDERTASRRREGAAARHRAPLHARSRHLLLRRAHGRAPSRPRRAGCAWSRWSTRCARSVTIEMDLRLEAAALSEMAREHQATIRTSACRRSTGTAPRATC